MRRNENVQYIQKLGGENGVYIDNNKQNIQKTSL